MNYSYVDIADIEKDDRFNYKITELSTTLYKSIERQGVLSPVFLQKRDSHLFLWSGFQRFTAAHLLGFSHIPGLIFDESLNLGDLFIMHIATNKTSRNFNLIEKANIFITACDSFGLEHHQLDLNFNEGDYSFFKMITNLPKEVISHYDMKVISDTTIRFLIANFPSDDFLEIIRSITNLKLSFQNQKLFLDMLYKILRKENITSKSLLDSVHIKQDITTANQNIGDKTNKVFKIMQKRAYPSLNHLEHEFNTAKENLHFSSNINIHPFPFFSSQGFQMNIKIKNKNQWQEFLNKINLINDNHLIDPFFDYK